jgi:hypothetical protein
VVEAAAILLGKIRPGQGLNTSELKDGFLWLCRMIASANANRANIFCEAINQYPTITGQQNYTLGANGIWNGARPMRITRANLLLPTSPTIRRHIEILTAAQWARIPLQATNPFPPAGSAGGIDTWPASLYCDYAFPLANIFLYPAPDAVYQIELYTWLANAKPANLQSGIIVPDGYEEFFITSLAIRLAGTYRMEVPPHVQQLYSYAMTNIQRANAAAHCPTLSSDAGRSGGLYNWLTGLRG